jgi:hypothetical protein
VNARPFVLPALALLVATPFLASSLAQPTRSAAISAQDHDEETKLGEAMEGIRADMKGLGKGLDAKDQDAAWKAVCWLQTHLLAAKQELPAKASSIDEAKRPAFVAAFRSRIVELLKASCDVETAVLAGKFDAADKIVKEVMWPMQKPAHREFRND